MDRWPNEKRALRIMVRVLWEHPSEWLSFRRLSRLIVIPDCDNFVIATIAENWPNLFTIHNDKRVILRPQVVEEIAKKGFENWKVPERPQPTGHVSRGEGSFAISDTQLGSCYCHSAHGNLLNDLKSGSIPSEALICSFCWCEICRVRGLNFNSIDPEVWEEICRRRGYILLRQNPRGF